MDCIWFSEHNENIMPKKWWLCLKHDYLVNVKSTKIWEKKTTFFSRKTDCGIWLKAQSSNSTLITFYKISNVK